MDVILLATSDLTVYGVSAILAQVEDMNVVGVAQDIHSCYELARQNVPDVIVVEQKALKRPANLDAGKLVDMVRTLTEDIQFLAITDSANRNRYEFARRIGIKGFCLSTIQSAELISAIRAVAKGKLHIHTAYKEDVGRQSEIPGMQSELTGCYELRERQLDVLNLLLLGYSNQEIADHLNVSYDTVRSHIKVILEKLHARDRVQAISIVFQDVVDNYNQVLQTYKEPPKPTLDQQD